MSTRFSGFSCVEHPLWGRGGNRRYYLTTVLESREEHTTNQMLHVCRDVCYEAECLPIVVSGTGQLHLTPVKYLHPAVKAIVHPIVHVFYLFCRITLFDKHGCHWNRGSSFPCLKQLVWELGTEKQELFNGNSGTSGNWLKYSLHWLILEGWGSVRSSGGRSAYVSSLWSLIMKWVVLCRYWDDWVRQPEQRRNRACIRPEISRTRTFGKIGVSK